MPSADILRSSSIAQSARVLQLQGLFDVPVAERSEMHWHVTLPIEDRPWNIGLIVGASGSGKTTVARELFTPQLISEFDWSDSKSIVDDFPKGMSIKEITALLSSVGFSSPPSWLRPFRVLSHGEQFRATVARAMAESSDLFVIDEFSSVVDRTVAKIGSCAIARTIRQRNQRFIAVSCHFDIIDWLQPDWVYDPGTDSFQWRELQCRPSIDLEIRMVHRGAWQVFKNHHYLSAELSNASRCFCAFAERQPAAFTAVCFFPHPKRPGWREHRTVCLPDFQGVGIGNALSDFVASLYRASGYPYFSTTTHPAMIRHRAKTETWKMNRTPGRNPPHSGTRNGGKRLWTSLLSTGRLSAGFEYIGPVRVQEAREFGIIKRPA